MIYDYLFIGATTLACAWAEEAERAGRRCAVLESAGLVGYDYAISIEHEDSLMSQNEGLLKAVETLKSAIIFEPKMTETRWI